jgi:hypothetical protein
MEFRFFDGERLDGSQTETSQNQPEPAKKPRTSVPPPQSARIAKRFIAGQSIRKIARQEGRDRETVKRIVQARDVQEYVSLLRVQYFELGSDAVDAFHHQLKEGKDARLGLQILKDVGVVPSNTELYRILHGEKIGRRGNAGTDAESDRFGRLRQPTKLVQ